MVCDTHAANKGGPCATGTRSTGTPSSSSATVSITCVEISDKFGQVTSLALELCRVLGEFERAGALLFEDCTYEHESFDVEERVLDLVRA